MKRTRLTIAAITVTALAAAAIPALAASPKDGAYADYKGHGANEKLVISLNVDGKKVYPSHFNDCAPVPIDYFTKVKESGKFKYNDTVKDLTGEKIDVNLKGKFKTPSLAVGVVDYDSKGCNGKETDFKAKYQGKEG